MKKKIEERYDSTKHFGPICHVGELHKINIGVVFVFACAGDNCSFACPISKFGPNCSLDCTCENGDCDAVDGNCTCYSGWHGDQCNLRCSPGLFGPDCSRECSCPRERSCDPTTGNCICGFSGITGKSCDEPCQARVSWQTLPELSCNEAWNGSIDGVFNIGMW